MNLKVKLISFYDIRFIKRNYKKLYIMCIVNLMVLLNFIGR